jgi:hypothetical protein
VAGDPDTVTEMTAVAWETVTSVAAVLVAVEDLKFESPL